MFSPLDILYIVLAFCVLWLSAASFWLIWQIANVIKNVNDFLSDARDTMRKIEDSIRAIRERIESMTSTGGVIVDAAKKLVRYAMDKKRNSNQDDTSA